jgi:uncharacterized paraquat-inducible protein A
MALINCSECECEVSDKAAACPRCGALIAPSSSPWPYDPREEGGFWPLLWVPIGLIGLGALVKLTIEVIGYLWALFGV